MLAVYATLLAVCVLVIAKVHHDARGSARQEALTRLGDATALVAAQLNGDHVTLLLEKYREPGLLIKHTQDAWYYVMHDHLRRTSERLGLEEPLVVLSVPPQGDPLIVATGAIDPRLRQPFDGDPRLLLTAVAEQRMHFMDPARDAMIAYDAVRNGGGEITGLVLGRMARSEAEAVAMGALRQHILLATLLFALAALVLFGSVGRWLRRDEEAHHDLLLRHGRVTDSIAYAAKIQRHLVPDPGTYNQLFADAFVIDRPKDVVSGDFHWVHAVDEHTCFVAAADCTGHGLPGAMMAAIGCSLLNELVPNHATSDPAELLAMLNTRLVITLHQQGRSRGAGDGMDIALCHIDRHERTILFAGAHRPLYWLRGDKLTVINGDRRPIGGAHQELERRYTVHRLAYAPGDRIYLFSDGYVDQFGGPEGKRFMSGRLHALLSEHRHLDMASQRDLLERAFLEWKGAGEQVDDVCMLGLAV